MFELALSLENLLDARNRVAEFNHASQFAGRTARVAARGAPLRRRPAAAAGC